MRIRTLLTLVTGLLLIGAPIASASTRTPWSGQKPIVVRPRWHHVTSDVYPSINSGVVDGNDYFALVSLQGKLSLLNKRTDQRRRLSPPGCENGSPIAGFGAGRLAVWCAPTNGSEQVDVYTISLRSWAEYPMAPEICDAQTFCNVDGVGATWIRIVEIGGFDGHPNFGDVLQNIRTGEVIPDPAGPGVQDDLSTPSGVGRPCPALASEAFDQADGAFGVLALSVPYWHQAGRFVLTTGTEPSEEAEQPDYLYECGTHLRLRLPALTFVSNAAVVYQTDKSEAAPLYGRYLPTLRPFTVPDPQGTLVAVSGTTLYALRGPNLWAGTFTHP